MGRERGKKERRREGEMEEEEEERKRMKGKEHVGKMSGDSLLRSLLM